MLRILNDEEQATVQWFRELEKEGRPHCESIRVDPLGIIAMALPRIGVPSQAVAWLAYIAAAAAGKGAIVTLNEEGCLVMALPRHIRHKQVAMPLE